MPIDLQTLGDKLRRYRTQLALSVEELSEATGVEVEQLRLYEAGAREPSGDEILVLADFYRCDYRFFISNERVAPFEQTENLYRRFGSEFSKVDRRHVQDFLFLCECEEFLEEGLGLSSKRTPFVFKKAGTFFKAHGEEAARRLRKHLHYGEATLGLDVFADIRKLGVHVFRRRLGNSNISGMCIKHPKAGPCLLINYSEDIFRQRFTAAHELGHAILDTEEEVVVSFVNYSHDDLVEVRANTFASKFLMPPSLLEQLRSRQWTDQEVVTSAAKLKVSTEALSYSLREMGIVSDALAKTIRRVRVPAELKIDPEIDRGLAPKSAATRRALLEMGLSDHYVGLCFEAYHRGDISRGRLAECLIADEADLMSIADAYGRSLAYGD